MEHLTWWRGDLFPLPSSPPPTLDLLLIFTVFSTSVGEGRGCNQSSRWTSGINKYSWQDGGATDSTIVQLLSTMDGSKLRRKATLLFQLSSCWVSGRLPHQTCDIVQNIHVLIQVCVLKILCLSFYPLRTQLSI